LPCVVDKLIQTGLILPVVLLEGFDLDFGDEGLFRVKLGITAGDGADGGERALNERGGDEIEPVAGDDEIDRLQPQREGLHGFGRIVGQVRFASDELIMHELAGGIADAVIRAEVELGEGGFTGSIRLSHGV